MSQLSFQGKKKQWKTKSLTWVFPFFAHLLDRSPLSQFLLTKQRMVKNSDNTEYPLAKKRGSHSSGSSPPPRILHSNNNAIRGFSIRYRQRMGGGGEEMMERTLSSPGKREGRETPRLVSPPKMVVSISAVFSAPIIRSSRGGNAGVFPEKWPGNRA